MTSITKAGLVDKIQAFARQDDVRLTKRDIVAVLDALRDVFADELAAGNKVSVPGVAALELKHREAGWRNNPRTKLPLPESWPVKARVMPSFATQVEVRRGGAR